MKLFFPNNIFGRLIKSNLPGPLQDVTEFHPSSMLTKKLIENPDSAALIPTIDLINNKELFVSKSFGISFESALCNTYLYFGGEQKDLRQLNVAGDVSAVEVVLSKILFKELYNTDIEIGVLSDMSSVKGKNLLISGDYNFQSGFFGEGISFSEEAVEALSLPYVNYLLASSDKLKIEKTNTALNGVAEKVYDTLDSNLKNEQISENAKAYISENISSFIMDFDEQDLEGVEQLIRLPYFHGIINDIVEVKYV